MKRVIVGTAGHIDHGKTRLVEALTGIDCDRWSEEKSRGITIDLGFAHLERGEVQLGFVDVPGHERFMHNALAGLGGIRIMLLVVAADEGIKPQTREHLAICSLLGIPAAIVALAKKDLVPRDLLELAQLEVEELLAETPFAGAPIVATSAESGEGVEELAERLFAMAEEHYAEPQPAHPPRLPIDRAFHLKGLGVVVTGSLVSGEIRVGDSLALLPGDGSARVRSIQVHGQSRQQAEVGERTALQLTGVTLEQLARGMELGEAEAHRAGASLLARFSLLADAPRPIRGSTPIRLHLYAGETVGRLRPLRGAIEPGSEGLVEMRLSRPVVAVRGDRFIIRRPSPPATLGGGQILDPSWSRRRGADLEEALTGLEGDLESALVAWVREGGEGGVEGPAITRRLGVRESSVGPLLKTLAKAQTILEIAPGTGHGRRWLDPRAVRRVQRRAERTLKDYFRRERLARGMPKAEAVRRILPGRSGELADVYLRWLQDRKVLHLSGDLVNLPGREAELTGEESSLAEQLLQLYETAGLRPPPPTEVQRELAVKPQIMEGVLSYLVQRGRLIRLPGELLIAARAIEEVAEALREGSRESYSVGDFKQQFDLTRKWAIPILEHLDSAGVTRRVGDQRQVVRRP